MWESVRGGTTDAGQNWFKTRLAITAHETEPWTVRAVVLVSYIGDTNGPWTALDVVRCLHEYLRRYNGTT